MMLEIIEILKNLPKDKNRTKLILIFIKELSANIQNCNSIWLSWGAEWHEVGANKQAIKYLKNIKDLEELLY